MTPKDLARSLRELHAGAGLDPEAVREVVYLLKNGEMPEFEEHSEGAGEELLAFGRAWLDMLSRRVTAPGASPVEAAERRAQAMVELRDNWPTTWTPESVEVARGIAQFIAAAHAQNTAQGEEPELQETTR